MKGPHANGRRATGFFRRFSGNRRGAVAIEFGLVALPFFAILVATFEIGYMHFKNELLAASIDEAVRALATGKLQSDAAIKDSSTFIKKYVCPQDTANAVYKNFDCSKFLVDLRPASSFASANLSNDIANSSLKFCPGNAGQIMQLRIAYPLPAIFPLNLFDPSVHNVTVQGKQGNYHILLAVALFQQENFSSAYSPPPGC